MDKWSQYFPFAKGDHLDIDGPANYDGEGEVTDVNEGVLEFSLFLPACTVWFFKHIPEKRIKFHAEYIAEGSGNKAHVTINEQEFNDDNVIVQSGSGWRRMQSSILVQGEPLVVILSRTADELNLKINGYKFTATRKRLFEAIAAPV